MNKLTLFTLIFTFILTVSLITKRAMSGDYEFSIETVTKEIVNDTSSNIAVELQSINEIINKTKQYKLIDLREKTDFEKGHLESAVNLPVKELIIKKTFSDFDDEKQNILYSYDYTTASNIVFYLKQIGIRNVKYLQADFADANNYLNGTNKKAKAIDKEAAKYNYNKFFNQPVNKTKPKISVPSSVKVKRASGGC